VSGPSGSGKTTLLCLLGCLLTPDRGAVYVNGRNVARLPERDRTLIRQRQIGFVFQAFRLFRALNAVDNVALAAEVSGQRAARRRARAVLEVLGLAHKWRL
jgi:putative ABC transport system ATP-binding protein